MTTASTFAGLKTHQAAGAPKDMRKAFADDPGRFARYSASLDDLLLDWSKCAVSDETMSLLHALADAASVEDKRAAMFAGEAINITENRAVLHVALRNRSNRPVLVGGKDVMPDVNDVLARMRSFSAGIRSGAIAASDGKPFSDVVNIGIGGSDLGPAMVTLALAPYHDGPRLHFVSNVDGAHIADTMKALDPARTLFLIASKTFTTIETMTNAHTARRWIADALGEAAVGAHFAALSTALDKVQAFGIASERAFGFWDWVGGRYSVWSAIGLPVMIAVGPDQFDRFLDGAHAMDEHFRTAPAAKNLPLIMGLIGIWHRDICGCATRAIIPYDQHLSRFPAYLQQLDMESNGKSVTLDGKQATQQTGPVVWGEPGTNGQHAFFQLLHQGTSIIPVEFLIAARAHEGPDLAEHHALLKANCLAQSEALMRGRTLAEAKAQLVKMGRSDEDADKIAPHRVFAGNRPSLTLAYRLLDPFTLGRLIALYEHRVFTEAAIWNINAFDQWGVELGKELATQLLPVVKGDVSTKDRDASTAGLVKYLAGL
ncbi:glucose-6-phosphate isomerase [soil metagenome]